MYGIEPYISLWQNKQKPSEIQKVNMKNTQKENHLDNWKGNVTAEKFIKKAQNKGDYLNKNNYLENLKKKHNKK